jgi:hypothetical protein
MVVCFRRPRKDEQRPARPIGAGPYVPSRHFAAAGGSRRTVEGEVPRLGDGIRHRQGDYRREPGLAENFV